MSNKIITVAHVGDFLQYPPVISLLENLLSNGNSVRLVSSTLSGNLPRRINKYDNFSYYYVPFSTDGSIQSKFKRFIKEKKDFKDAVVSAMKDSQILWTTTDVTMKILGDTVLDYKHVMQLMELVERYPSSLKLKIFDFPIEKYARKAYKVVVPDLDRAYIQQAWWNLKEVPIVLPNKPYSIYDEKVELNSEEVKALEKIKNEKRKVILYSGVITPERNIGDFAKAIRNRSEYCIYVMGRAFSRKYLDEFINSNPNVEYLGYFAAPKHLSFVKYAYAGLTPYVPTNSNRYPKINALYCAPNKVYEYSAFGVPMLGTNVLGLLRPFEQYKIGKCSKDMTKESILQGLDYIDSHHDEMSKNAIKFFNKDDLDEIVRDIIEDK